MTSRGQDIVSVIKQQIEQFGADLSMVDVGNVIEIGDGIARIHGLAAARYNELLQFPDEVMGIALNLEEDGVAAVVLGVVFCELAAVEGGVAVGVLDGAGVLGGVVGKGAVGYF